MPDAAEIDPLVLELDDRGDLGEPVDPLEEWVFDRFADAAGDAEQAAPASATWSRKKITR